MTRWRRRLVVVALAAGLAVPPATATADLEDDLTSVLAEIGAIEDQLDAAAGERTDLVDAIFANREELTQAWDALDTAESALTELRVSMAALEFESNEAARRLDESVRALATIRREISTGRMEAEEWARQRYMQRSADDLMPVLLSSRRVSDLGNALYIIDLYNERSVSLIDRFEALGRQEERQQQRIEEQQLELQAAEERLAIATAQQVELTEQRRQRASTVEARLDEQRGLLATLDAEIEEFTTELDGLAAEQERLEALIRGAVAGGGTSPGQLTRPVPGPITSAFGPRLHPILGYTRMHTGVDMSAPHGQEISAGAAGTVILATGYGGYGLTVVIDHGGGMATLYAHQSRLAVAAGDVVAGGQVIGFVGSTGLSTGPHLHFEVRVGGSAVDPAGYL